MIDAYRDILRVARHFTRTAEEARDLAQDTVAIALARGFRDWPAPAHRAWLHGVVRKRAAMVVREQTRRRRREQAIGLREVGPERGSWVWQPTFLASLPASLRTLATLVSADLAGAEIRWLLGLTDTAFRQRLAGLRRRLRASGEVATMPEREPSATFGPHRAQVLASLRARGGRVFASHDPDGHAIFFRTGAHGMPRPGNR